MRRSLKDARFKGSTASLGKRAVLMLRVASSSWAAVCCRTGVVVGVFLPNQDVLVEAGVLITLGALLCRRGILRGRSVKLDRYSMTSLLSSFSLLGETGGPNRRRFSVEEALEQPVRCARSVRCRVVAVGLGVELGHEASQRLRARVEDAAFPPKSSSSRLRVRQARKQPAAQVGRGDAVRETAD